MDKMNENLKSDGRRVVVAGIGDAGCNVVLKVSGEWGATESCTVINTDRRVFADCPGVNHLEIGGNVTKGMGSGGNIGLGRRAAVTSIDSIKNLFVGADMALVVAGLGGGTGTGALPVVLEAAHGQGVLTVAFCILPFLFEGDYRMSRALDGLDRIQSVADKVFVMKNQLLFDVMGEDVNITEAFKRSDEMLAPVLFSLWRTVAHRGVINHDFTDIRAVLEGRDECLFGFGLGSGESRAPDALKALEVCPLLGVKSDDSKNKFGSLVVNIVSGPNLSLGEIDCIFNGIKGFTRDDATISVGAACADELKNRLLITILASPEKNEAKEELASPTPATDAQLPERTVRMDEKAAKLKKAQRLKQATLFEEAGGQGRFKDAEPTIYRGNNLDVPTFKRLNIMVQRIKEQTEE